MIIHTIFNYGYIVKMTIEVVFVLPSGHQLEFRAPTPSCHFEEAIE
jgi:hypothetical protein